ncbi:MAG: L,D-transpeptidase [Paracoccus sp. (in: a-proteobacteria)]|nr:L,D-transpeptidase [Paracoccus sp. (in: a-proteobacteria)]
MTHHPFRTHLPRRAFLGGLVAAGAGLSAAHAQDAALQRNLSSFRARHWSEFFPSLGVGVILADVNSRAVHYWSGSNGAYRVYPSSIPMTNELTRRGLTEVVRKAANPSWTPTENMRRRDPSLPARVEGGAPDNPLGPYALYLSWPAYLIHGTHDTRKVGRRSSSGCYGLYNEHITELFGMAEVGTRVAVF